MKNKGFTLIELLAVIVILAIIALIATPIIIGIINDARNESRIRSAEAVANAVETAYLTSMMKVEANGSSASFNNETVIENTKIDNERTRTINSITTNDGVVCQLSSGYVLTCTYDGKNLIDPKLIMSYTGTIYRHSDVLVSLGDSILHWCISTGSGNSCHNDGTFDTVVSFNSQSECEERLDSFSNPYGDGDLYCESEELDYVYNPSNIVGNGYLKHEVKDNIITSVYACEMHTVGDEQEEICSAVNTEEDIWKGNCVLYSDSSSICY